MSTQQMAAEEAGVQTDTSRPPAPDYPDDAVDEPQVGEDDTHGELDTFDIFSLIVNKMIGTGVYTAPASVYLMTEHKSLALGLWVIGFFYTILSMCMYLDYAAAFPFTGGELVYLDEITAYSGPRVPFSSSSATTVRRLAGDGLLAYVIYSVLFVSIFNSGTNAMQFGRMVLLAINSENGADEKFSSKERHLLRFLGVVALTTLCMIQYLSPRSGRHLNTAWAVVKIAFVIGLIITGAKSAADRHVGKSSGDISVAEEWEHSIGYNYQHGFVWAKALLAVLFSFEGWENATFVAGQVPQRNHDKLRRGFMYAVCCVGILYLAVVAVFLQATPVNNHDRHCLSHHFFPASLSPKDSCGTSTRAWAIVAAISSLGSLNSIIFTFSRVKQSIGDANILPWSDLWRSDHLVRNGDTVVDKSPRGGLLLHWIMTVVVVIAVSGVSNTHDSVTLPGYLQTYAHSFVLLVLGVAFISLSQRENAMQLSIAKNITRFSQQTGIFYAIVLILVTIYTGLNIILLVFGAWTLTPNNETSTNITAPANNTILTTTLASRTTTALATITASANTTAATNTPTPQPSYPNWIYAVVLGGLIAIGVFYYALVFGTATWSYRSDLARDDGTNQQEEGQWQRLTVSGILPKSSMMNLLQIARVRVVIFKDRRYLDTYERVHRFGRRWRAQYALREDLRHPDAPGRNEPVEDDDGSEPRTIHLNFFYWTFGGRRWVSESPWEGLKNSLYYKWSGFVAKLTPSRAESASDAGIQLNGVNGQPG